MGSYQIFKLLPVQDEKIGVKDEWLGLKDAKERRKRQNRLNQRASRRRQKLSEAQSYGLSEANGLKDSVYPPLPAQCPQEEPTQAITDPFASHSISTNTLYFPLTPDTRLLHVIGLNVSRAIITNYSIISLFDPSAGNCCEGLGTLIPPTSTNTLFLDDKTSKASLPSALSPTLLQQQIPHLRWIDLFPSPQMRDNLIIAFAERRINEDDFALDLLGGIFDGLTCSNEDQASGDTFQASTESQATNVRPTFNAELGLISWSDPWDISGWEVTDTFVKKWGFLFKDCSDVVTAANAWRDIRGEEPLVIEI